MDIKVIISSEKKSNRDRHIGYDFTYAKNLKEKTNQTEIDS